MKPEIKKQIILHLPYLAFVYLFGKVGQAFRLAQGADISAKLLHIGQGFSAAFASAAPSFHPMMSHDRLYALALYEWTEQHFAQNSDTSDAAAGENGCNFPTHNNST